MIAQRRAAGCALIAIGLAAVVQTLSAGQAIGTSGGQRPAAPPPGAVPPPGPGTGAISGRVVDAATGAPVPGADVWLRRSTGGPGYQMVARELTDGRGRFVFTELPPSPGYALSASAPGYLEPTDAFDRAPAHTVLADGQWLPDARVAVVRAGSLEGTVIDERGEPIVGIPVRIISEVHVAGTTQLAAGTVTFTDDRGRYRIGQLRAGRYFVSVPSVQASVPTERSTSGASQTVGRSGGPADPPPMLDLDEHARLSGVGYPLPTPDANGRMRAFPVTFHPSAAAIGDATAVEVAAGAMVPGIDIRMQPVSAVRVAGRLEGPAGLVSNRLLRLVSVGLEGLGPGSEAASAQTAADGAFTFLNVPSGRYVLSVPTSLVEYQTFSMLRSPRLPTPPGRGGSWMSTSVPSGPEGLSITVDATVRSDTPHGARIELAVGATDVSDLVVPLRPAGLLTGRIAVDGQVQGPPRSFSVHLEPADGNPALGYLRTNTIQLNAGDEFAIAGLQPGEYIVGGTNSLGWMVQSVTVDGRDRSFEPIDATATTDIGNVVVTFTNRGARLTGRVVSPAATDAAAMVVIFPADESGWTRYGLAPLRIRSILAASDGSFEMPNLPAGDYLVAAVRTDDARAWRAPGFFARVRGEAAAVTLTWGGTHTVAPRLIDIR